VKKERKKERNKEGKQASNQERETWNERNQALIDCLQSIERDI
jgi:hypothetical protein